MFRRLLMMIAAATLVAILAGCGGSSQEAEEATEEDEVTVLRLARFFGDCDDTTDGVTDVDQATSECEVIQILTNKFNAENEGSIRIERLGGAEWGTYYDGLNTSFAGGDPPDVAVMHGSNMPDYTSRDLLQPIEQYFDEYGIDPDDWTAPARGAVQNDGEYYGVAFDLHALLAHVNVDLFREAGLVDDDGNPILPGSREEFFQQAAAVQEATGAQYFATDASQFPFGVRLMFSLVWQQGSDLVSADGSSATVDTPEAGEAVDFMLEMFDAGYADPNFNYTAAQEAFLSGEAAILLNGTWAVDQYRREAEFDYMALDFPSVYDEAAVWANSHMWVLPKQQNDPKYEAGMEFLTYLHNHVYDWAAGTGHLAPRSSVLTSDELQSVPQRQNYESTADIAKLVPSIENWQAVEDILKEEVEATWLTGKPVSAALSSADSRINDVLQD
jgi:multiple sugar transport system substrate-binding protein